MINFWTSDGNRCLTISYDKLTLYKILKVEKTNSVKGVDSFYEKNVWVLGFKFTYTNVNYDNIVFIELKPENTYNNNSRVKVLKEILKAWTNTYTTDRAFPPFNWNLHINENGEYTYYITGVKQWFIDNDLECLVNSLREITFDDEKRKYFPKYNPHKTNKVKIV